MAARVALTMNLGLTASISALTLATSSASGWIVLPTVACMRGYLGSALTWVLPPSNSLALASGLGVTVPALGLGINPLGPNSFAYLASLGMKAGLVTKMSKSITPLSSLAKSSSLTIATFLAAPAA